MKSKYCKNGVVSCKSLQKLAWPNSQNSCSEMFQKKGVVKFLGKHEWPETALSYTGIKFAAWNITEETFDQRYFPATYLKLKNSIIPHGTTVISCQLSFHVYCAAVPCLYK